MGCQWGESADTVVRTVLASVLEFLYPMLIRSERFSFCPIIWLDRQVGTEGCCGSQATTQDNLFFHLALLWTSYELG